jgi:hypothetical protein
MSVPPRVGRFFATPFYLRPLWRDRIVAVGRTRSGT